MVKKWECDRCGDLESLGIVRSAFAEPETCSSCGSTAFKEPFVTGSVHRAIDGLVG